MALVLVLNRERHVAAMTRWGVHFARALKTSLHLIIAKEEAESYSNEPVPEDEQTSSIWTAVEETLLAANLTANRATADEATTSDIAVVTRLVSDATRVQAVLSYVAEVKPRLLLVGKQESVRSDQAPAGILARTVFERAPCPTMLLRLGNHEGGECRSILVPTTKGTHVSTALKLARSATAEVKDGHLMAVVVEPRAGQEAQDLGEVILRRALSAADIDEDAAGVSSKVLLANDVLEALGDEAECGDVDLVLFGLESRSGIRKRLFGTMPDRMANRPGGMAVAVVRGALPVTEVLRNRLDRWLSYRVPQLDRDQRVQFFERLQIGSRLSLDFLVLIALSTAIAAFGLLQNSTAVVIGAMLVAPLMTPLLGAGMALVQGNLPMIRSCFYSIVIGFLLAITIGTLTGIAAYPIIGMTSELTTRGGPTLLDFGVALMSGIAASYCLARPGLSSALAGVAIAAALVPPIATTGIALSFQRSDIAAGAALLFGTNVVTIILGAALTFFVIGIRGARKEKASRWVRGVTFALLLAVIAMTIPLSRAMFSKVIRRPLSRALAQAVETEHSGAQVTEISISKNPDSNELTIGVETPEALSSGLANTLSAIATEHFDQPTTVRLKEQRIRLGKPPTPNKNANE